MHISTRTEASLRFGLGAYLGLFLLWAGSAYAGRPVPQVNWPGSLTGPCKAQLNGCFINCFQKIENKKDSKGALFPTRILGLFCYRRCQAQRPQMAMCRQAGSKQQAPPPSTGSDRPPTPEQIKRLPKFCRHFLGICMRSCIKQNRRLQDSKGKPYPLSVLQTFCSRRCWQVPTRKRICKMSRKSILKHSKKLLKQTAKELNQAKQEEKEAQKKLQKQKRELQKQQLINQGELKRLKKERKRQERLRQLQLRRLTSQFKELNQDAARLRQENRKLTKASQARLKVTQERLRLQKEQLKEQQKRMAILRKQLEEKQRQDQARQAQEKKRQEAQKKLIQEQQKQLDELRKQREDYTNRIKSMKGLLAREKELRKQNRALLQQKQQAAQLGQKEKAALGQKLQKLQRELAQMKKLKKKFAANQQKFRKTRKAGKKRLAMLQRSARKAYRRRRRRRRSLKSRRQAYMQRLFNKGDFSSLKRYFKRIRKHKELQKLESFVSLYRDARSAYDTNDYHIAVPKLERSLTLAMDLGGPKNRYNIILRTKLANMYYGKGRLALNQEAHVSAFIYFNSALQYLPSHKLSLAQIANLAVMAESLRKRAQSYPANSRMRRQLLVKAGRLVPKNSKLSRRIQKELER